MPPKPSDKPESLTVEMYLEKVCDHLNRIENRCIRTEEHVGNLREDVAALKVKAGVWGTIGGVLAAVGVSLSSLWSK